MPTYGGFETIAELHRGGRGSVWSARRPEGGEPLFAVKLLQPDAMFYGREAASELVAAFLETAEVQRRAATAGGAGGAWAPIHGSGVQEDGAYLVTDLFNRSSVERLVAGRFRVDGVSLHRVASAVVQGLVELDRACRRAHGNLKASNVLVAGDGAVTVSRAALADPASDARAKSVGTAGDLRALGEIIHQFVLHQPFRGAGGYPVRDGSEWHSLGPGGRQWLELTNRLLDPAPASQPTLDEVSERVAAAGAARKGRPGPLFIGAGVAALLVIAGGGYWLLGGSSPKGEGWTEDNVAKWKQYAVDYADWGQPFIADLDQPAGAGLGGIRSAVYSGDDGLRAVVEGLDEEQEREAIDSRRISGNERGDINTLDRITPKDWRAVAKMKAAAAKLDAIRQLARGESWAPRQRLHEAAEAWKKRGWARAAEALEEGAEPFPLDKQAAAHFDRVLALDRVRARIEGLAGEVDTTAATLDGTGDTVLAKFRGWARADVQDPKTIEELEAALQHSVKLGQELAAAYQGGEWQRIDAEYFRGTSPVYSAASAPDQAYFQGWLAEVRSDKYTRPDAASDPTNPARWHARESLDSITKKAAKLDELKKPLDPATRARIESLGRQVAELENTPWIRANAARKREDAARTEKELDELLAVVTSAERDARETFAEDLADAKRQLNEPKDIAPGSPAISAAWVAWRTPVAAAMPDDYAATLETAHRVEGALAQFHSDLRAATPSLEANRSWFAALTAVISDERERRAAKALEAIAGQGAGIDVDALVRGLTAASGEYGVWAAGVATAGRDAGRLADLLDAGYGLDEPTPEGGTLKQRAEGLRAALAQQPAVAKALAAVPARVEKLERIASATTVQDIDAATASDTHPEVAIAAWRRLASLDGAWPSSAGDLRRDDDFRARAAGAANVIDAADRKEALASELAQGAAVRWMRAFRAAGSKDEIEAVAGQMSAHGVKAADVTDDRLAYNLLVADLGRGVAAAADDDARVQALVKAFVESARVRAAESLTVQKVKDALAVLGPIASEAEAPVKAFDPGVVGPGAATPPWKGELAGPNGSDALLRYALGDQVLTFARVEVSDAKEAAYLCTTEMSLGAMLGVLQSAGQDAAFVGLTAPNPSGPTGWIVEADGKTLAEAGSWLPTQHSRVRTNFPEVSETPAGVGVETPGPGSPVQQVSPAGALYVCRLMGCRLPTAAEWRAAAGPIPSGDAALSAYNLRDAAWKAQLDHVQSVFAKFKSPVLDDPDAGAYKSGDKGARTSDDKVILFRPVDAASPGPFHDLYGNVWELVLDDVAGMTAVSAPADVKKFVVASTSKLGLLGGSALSAPSIDLGTVQPIDRFSIQDGLGFSDAGFRPAFSAEGGGRVRFSVQVAQALTADPYVYPPGR
ncbi:MAG: SUMF1/EgtB/PvdO family nonheme iron enzyme [Phycisphaerales bacterium]|nr:SUMF1/EgtB/PvdO family nonheme iron enzyme [Phycisphaerales bacterium]